MAAITRTPAEVAERTGATVTATTIASAVEVVSAVVGRELVEVEPPVFTRRDLRLLKQAIDWQAAYLTQHPDVLTREAFKRASTNGVSIEHADGDDGTASLVAPLVRMVLRRLSWRRSRSIAMTPTLTTGRRVQTLVDDGAEGDWTRL